MQLGIRKKTDRIANLKYKAFHIKMEGFLHITTNVVNCGKNTTKYHKMQQSNSIRINKDILEDIKFISKEKGQTISGYINLVLSRSVQKDMLKFKNNFNAKEVHTKHNTTD